ncbi:MAG: 4-carboxy-4-hydroxy-2-oxoadipate aldolase/oxaloacetate decarboxylase [Rhodospirillales bacterium]|nr:4-carboxy-4-hydroxy-2-oxoadipate aldolase/oxaloacetate decarboxylase [Rhodospirillales bacterium]
MTVQKTFDRPEPQLVANLAALGAATLHEAMGQRGALPHTIKPVYQGMKVAGPALTVDGKPADNLMAHYALSLGQPGDVLVVDYKAYLESGPWGDVMTTAALAKGIAGLIVNGAVRDVESCWEMGFPLFAITTSMKGSTKMLPGSINVPIVIGDIRIAPGDIVVGDDDGVVVVPRQEAAETLEKAQAREAKEEEIRGQLKAGKTTVELLDLEPVLRSHGLI